MLLIGRPWPLRYGVAALFAATACLLRLGLDPWLAQTLRIELFYGAVALTVWFAGLGPAVVSAVLGLLLADYFFIAPRHALGLGDVPTFAAIFAYGITCGLIIIAGEWAHRRRARAERDARTLQAQAGRLREEIRVRRQAEEESARLARELRERVTELETVLETVPLGVMVADRTGEVITPNRAALEMLELPHGANPSFSSPHPLPDRMAGARLFVDGREVAPDELPLQRCLRAGQPLQELEHEIVYADGTSRVFHCNVSPLFDEHGSVRGAITAFLDMTERKRAQEALRLHSRVLEHMTEGVSVADDDGVIVYTNAAEDRMFGYAPGELTGQPVAVLNAYPAEENARIVGEIRAQLRREGVWKGELQNRRKDGTTFCTEAHISTLERDGRTLWICVQRDVTAQKLAAQALRESEERFRRVADAMPEAINVFVARADGTVEYVNRRWRDYTGQDEPTADAYRRLIPPEDLEPMWAQWTRCMQSGQPFAAEFRMRRASDGTQRWFLSRAVPVRDDTGRIVRWVGASVDIDDQKRAQQSLAAADRRKDEFLAVLAHELRNPLAPIRNGLQILKLAGTDAERAKRTTEMMERQLSHLVRLIDDLLDVSRITRGKLELRRERLLLDALLRDVLDSSRPLMEAKRLRSIVRIGAEPVPVEGDPHRLVQVFSNLLSNAAKYTEPGGTVTLGLQREANEAVVSVADSGIGIAPENLEKVFEMFSQLQPRGVGESGLGIGLALVRQLVQLHGGAVRAQSAGPGHGSEFVVRLPLARPVEHARPGPAPQQTGEAASRPPRILVADDDDDAAAQPRG